MKVHTAAEHDYDDGQGFAFGRGGGGAPVLDPINHDQIDTHFRGIHKPIKVMDENVGLTLSFFKTKIENANNIFCNLLGTNACCF